MACFRRRAQVSVLLPIYMVAGSYRFPALRAGGSRVDPWLWALASCKPPPSLAREGRAADSPAGRFDGLRRTRPLCAVSSSSLGLRIQGPGLQNPRGHGLPRAAPPPPQAPSPRDDLHNPSPQCPTAPYHVIMWYNPSTRTRVPSFGQTFPSVNTVLILC